MLLFARLIDLYSLIVLVAVIMSWVPLDRRNPVATLVRGLTEARPGTHSQRAPAPGRPGLVADAAADWPAAAKRSALLEGRQRAGPPATRHSDKE